MSSHHIVREAQEPALFIWQPQAATGEQLLQLLEWSPTVLVKEETLEAALEQGIKVDIVLYCPEKSTKVREQAALQQHMQLIPSTTEDMLDTALRHLAKQGQQAINILTADTAALESLLPALASQTSLPYVAVLSGTEKWSFYRSGHFSKWLPEGEEIKVRAAAAAVEISSKGFSGTPTKLLPNQALLLHTSGGGHKHIRANGPFWVAETLA